MEIEIQPGVTMTYDDEGQGSVVVLLHAFPLSRAMWDAQRAALSLSYRVITPDQRGFGGTSRFEGQPSIAQMARDVDALLTALHITEPVVLGGLSMGGYVSLEFARQFPQRLRGLILADTRAEADTPEGVENRNKMLPLAEAGGGAAVIEKMLPNMLCKNTLENHPDVVATVRSIAGAQSPGGVSDAIKALRDRADAGPWLANIAVPTLVIVGEEDTLTPPAMAERLARDIADARLVRIPQAGHLSNLEQPETFNTTLLEFLGSTAPR